MLLRTSGFFKAWKTCFVEGECLCLFQHGQTVLAFCDLVPFRDAVEGPLLDLFGKEVDGLNATILQLRVALMQKVRPAF